MLKQLGEQDASFLYLETTETPQHVGGMSIVELPAGYKGNFYEDFKAHIGSRLHLIPMLHTKLVPLPFDIDHPFWIDDPDVDLNYHVRHLSLPKPGRISQLEQLIGRVHSNFLDRTRPLWEFYVIDGLESGHVAIYTKIHHAAMDGASSQLLIQTMYDPTPVPRRMPPPPPKQGDEKSKVEIEEVLRGIAAHFLRQEIRAIQFIPDVLKAWANLVLPDVKTLRYDKGIHLPQVTPKTLINCAITSQRAYAVRTLSLSRVKKLAKAADVKLNDIVLELCSTALRRYLLDKDALPHDAMTALVPVSMHKSGDTEMNNQNVMFVCNLATDLPGAVERLHAIRESSTEQKKFLSNVRNALLPDLSIIGSGALMRGMVEMYSRAKLADRLPPVGNLFISNVPGPPIPLYIAGAKILTMYPCSIPFHGTALNITVHSYIDSLDFGLTACRRAVPDVTDIADHIVDALSELEAAINGLPVPVAIPATKARSAAEQATEKAARKSGVVGKAKTSTATDKPKAATTTKALAKPTTAPKVTKAPAKPAPAAKAVKKAKPVAASKSGAAKDAVQRAVSAAAKAEEAFENVSAAAVSAAVKEGPKEGTVDSTPQQVPAAPGTQGS